MAEEPPATIHVVATSRRLRLFEEYLEDDGASLAPDVALWNYEELAGEEALPRGVWILADLDGLGPAGRELAARTHDALAAAGCRVLNDPRRTLRRLDLLRALHDAGINRFRAVRAGDGLSGLRFPVFVRCASDHLGPLGELLHSPAEVEHVVDRAGAVGIDVDDLIVVEFRDTSDGDGLFRKGGVLVIGGRLVPQHLFVAPSWMIKCKGSLFTLAVAREESAWTREFEEEEQLRRVVEIAGVDYGRIDYARDRDGRVQVWEINLCPILGRGDLPDPPPPPEAWRVREERRARAYARILDAWRALADEASSRPSGPSEASEASNAPNTSEASTTSTTSKTSDATEASEPSGPPGRSRPCSPSVALRVPVAVREATRRELAPRTGGAALMETLRAKAWFSRW